MSRRPLNALITVAFSTRGRLMPAWMSQHLAADAGLSVLDQDASSPLAAWFTRRGGNRESYVPTASLWLPISTASSDRSQRLVRQVIERQGGDVPSMVLLVSSLQYRDLTRQVVEIQAQTSARLLLGHRPQSRPMRCRCDAASDQRRDQAWTTRDKSGRCRP